MISAEELLRANARGIFPGPSESDVHFLSRCAQGVSVVPAESSELTKKRFGAAPDWVDVHCQAKGLLPWEGAATWIEEREGQRAVSIQFKPSLLGYPKDEVIAHELVHAMRLHFDESRFEEILAYRTSENRFRRYFGPLFSRPWEATLFLSLLALFFLSYWAEMLFAVQIGASYLFWLPLLALCSASVRLIRSQSVFNTASCHLQRAIRNPEDALAVLLRLSDAEIAQLAKLPPQAILSFAEQRKGTSLRWRQLFLAYFC